MSGIIGQLDHQIAQLFQGWNSYSTAIAAIIVIFVIVVVTESRDPDTHPLLLARQAQASFVRQPGESAVYRSPEVPHGYALKTGLQVRAPGAPLYSPGKDGDLRDIWRRVNGELPFPKDDNGQLSRILTVYSKTDIVDHTIADLTKEIAVIGKHLQSQGAKRVAVYVPNSIELLSTLFAGAFYGFTVILLPFNQPHPTIAALLNESKADSIVAAAGSFPLADISKSTPTLKNVIWTVEKTSRHVDWSEVPEGIGGRLDVAVWHELVQDSKNGSELPKEAETDMKPGNIVFVSQGADGGDWEFIEFTQENIVAAVAALISSLPSTQRFTPADMVLPAESLTHSYPLALTLAALFQRANVALTSVAGQGVSVGLAIRSVSPTVLILSAESAVKLHAASHTFLSSSLKKFGHWLATRTLSSGRMPEESSLRQLIDGSTTSIENKPAKMRLLYISERVGAATPPLSSSDLSDLRIFTKARVIYALTAPKVAGAVAQTNIFDYRRGPGPKNKHSHFGMPLSSVEVILKDTTSHKTTDEQAIGEIVVRGPAVLGKETSLGIAGKFNEDHTLAYV